MSRGRHIKHKVGPVLREYLTCVGNKELPWIEELRKETYARYPDLTLMVTGISNLTLIRWLVSVTKSRKAIEVGVFTGSSAMAIAQALPSDGQLIAIDVNEEYVNLGRKYWKKAGVNDKIQVRLDGGINGLTDLCNDPSQLGTFDFIYLDALKKEYTEYARLATKLLRKGGLLMADNTLMNLQVPKIAQPSDSAHVIGMRNFNLWLKESSQFDSININLEDGVALASKL